MSTEPYVMDLSLSERQVISAVLRIGDATLADVCECLPTLNSGWIQIVLKNLADKGHLSHRRQADVDLYSAAKAEDKKPFGFKFITNAIKEILPNGDISDAEMARLSGTLGCTQKKWEPRD